MTSEEAKSKLEGRALSPPTRFRRTRDVTPAAFMFARSSPGPFALAVYTAPPDSDSNAIANRPLNLMYVSQAVAEDRSVEVNDLNAPGVLPGWYAVAQPGVYFEVRYRRVNTNLSAVRCGVSNVLLSRLYVDGVPASRTTVYDVEQHGDAVVDQVDIGFDVGSERQADGEVRKSVRRFQFKRSDPCEGLPMEQRHRVSTVNAGTIHLRVKVGDRVAPDVGDDWGDDEGVGDCGVVREADEESVIKHGRAIQAVGEVMATQQWVHASCGAINLRPWPEADIIVHVREVEWMRSRRLIDKHGNPVTYAAFKTMLEEEAMSMRMVSGVGSKRDLRDDDTKRGVRKKIKEFVDLT